MNYALFNVYYSLLNIHYSLHWVFIMITLRKISKCNFSEIYKKLENAFPYEERRDFKDYEIYFRNNHFLPFEIIDGEKAVGFINLWAFDSFIYVEHIAIDPEIRGGGYGTKAINLVKEKYNKPIILESEAPKTKTQIKRIRFYENLGFKVNDFDYYQPSYHNADPVPLKILSYPELLTEMEYEKFLSETKTNVYFN